MTAFEMYLRTGKRPSMSGIEDGVEVKFNPWHDPDDGRFTFAGRGQYYMAYGQPAPKRDRPSLRTDRPRRDYPIWTPRHDGDPKNPRNYTIHAVRPGDTLSGIAARRKGVTVSGLAWLNDRPPDRPLKIGEGLKLPTQASLDAAREAKNRVLALEYYMDRNGGKLPPNVAKPPSIADQLASERSSAVKNGYTSRSTVLSEPTMSKGTCRMYARGDLAAINCGLAGLTGWRVITGVIISLCASTAPAIASTISPRIPASIAAPIALSKMDGRENCTLVDACMSRSPRIMSERRFVLTNSMSLGTSMANDTRGQSQTKKRIKMAADKYESLGPLFNEVGGELSAITDGDIDGTYLYAEVEEGSPYAGVFHDEGNVVRYYDPTDRLFDLLLQAWEIENSDSSMRWAVMEYIINDGRFKTTFQYREELKKGEFVEDRRRRALKKRYGDKLIVYPPIPERASEVRSDEEQP